MSKFQRLLVLFLATILVTSLLVGQTTPASSSTNVNPPNISPEELRQLLDALHAGIAVQGLSTVRDSVSVEAVLLPASVSKKIFGKEVSNNYAVIELVVSNRNKDAALIMHSIYLDYNDWILSGSPLSLQTGEDAKAAAASAAAAAEGKSPATSAHAWQATTLPNQIASAEYRIVRGELLDAQQWTGRNLFIRGIQGIGSIASGYAFSLKENGFVRGIASFNGQVIPAAELFWPDGTTAQMNRISDVGFQVNKVVGKENSEIVVAFFPIDRFLSPALKKLFIKSPAVFFAPLALLMNKSESKEFFDVIEQVTGYTPDYIQTVLKKGMQAKVKQESDQKLSDQEVVDFKEFTALSRLLYGLSLNSIRIVVGGTMSVDVDTLPPSIQSVDMEGGNSSPDVWAIAGDKKGVIHGRFLSNATPVIDDTASLHITNLAADPKTSTDTDLAFTFTLGAPVLNNTTLHFSATRNDKQGKTLTSTKFDQVVNYSLSNLPVVRSITTDPAKLTVAGEHFFDLPNNALTVYMNINNSWKKLSKDSVTLKSSQSLEIDLTKVRADKGVGLVAGTWPLKVMVGTMSSNVDQTFIEPATP